MCENKNYDECKIRKNFCEWGKKDEQPNVSAKNSAAIMRDLKPSNEEPIESVTGESKA
jgi:hypothetical protein